MTENTHDRKFTDKATGYARDSAEQMKAGAEQAADLMQNAFKGVRDYNLRVLEIARANSEACFNFAQQLVAVKSPSEMVELSTDYARKQFAVLTEQTKELASLGQKVTKDTAEPITSAMTKSFSKVA